MASAKGVALAAGLSLATGAAALAAPGHHGGHGFAYGQPGKAAAATRTITITMHDNYYEPERIQVRAGETVRLIVVNKGELLHEFAIGRPEDHAEHQKMMAEMVDHGMITATSVDHQKMKMDHSGGGHGSHGSHQHSHGPEAGNLLLEPGKTAEMVWTFPKDGVIEFACNIPGHYEAGMVGKIDFRR
ncbi:MAG: cupredoxin domain-containing protein [Alphaproteobacteria bacterium]|nr:cupredoxin domain-containing protein [Alphaproteobacteria bacterium]